MTKGRESSQAPEGHKSRNLGQKRLFEEEKKELNSCRPQKPRKQRQLLRERAESHLEAERRQSSPGAEV